MHTKYIIGNWKMHGTRASAESLANSLRTIRMPIGVKTVVCPPSPLLQTVQHALSGSPIGLGAQDCHIQREGAFTGNVSAAMLKDAGCGYIIVGHSERRQQHGETDAMVNAKATRVIEEGLIPIICIGETLVEREAGSAEQVVASQLAGSLPKSAALGQFLLAYEPVWAIGSGRIPADTDITAMHGVIKEAAGMTVPVLYGGSVKASNAKQILGLSDVNGVLVGGASLKADEFIAIIQAAER